MDKADESVFDAFVFSQRGMLLALPAVALAALGKPSAFSIALGLPIAFLGEAVRCWAVGYSGVTTRGDRLEAPALVTAGPYAHVRNPLYVGNFITALGFAVAFTGKNGDAARAALVGGSLAMMLGVYSVIVPHEERFLEAEFGEPFRRYLEEVPRIVPQLEATGSKNGAYDIDVIGKAETRTFATFGVMLGILALKALR